MSNNKLTDEQIVHELKVLERDQRAGVNFFDFEIAALRELQLLRLSYLALRGEIEDVQAQLYEAENQAEYANTELQERRKADSAEPVAWQYNWHSEGWRQCKNKREYDEIIRNGNPNFKVRQLYAAPQPLNDAERAELQERRKFDDKLEQIKMLGYLIEEEKHNNYELSGREFWGSLRIIQMVTELVELCAGDDIEEDAI
ncbi:hypothetical protein A8319_002498 [Escherichia coli]|nr:hypothetical protein [Escherichia coli]